MGSNLNGFDVNLKFDAEGKVETATYIDQEGCGHEHAFEVGVGSMVTLQNVIDYHLSHYSRSHDMTPPKRCDFEVKTPGLVFRCTEKPHDKYTKHRLEQV